MQRGIPQVKCRHCGKYIIQTNYLIHQSRCQVMSSRFRKQAESKPQFKPESSRYPIRQQEISIERPSKMFPNRSIIPNIPNRSNLPNQDNDRIPCSFCGYLQTFAELDTHPDTCPSKQHECNYCKQTYPISLMDDHQQVCSAREHQNNQDLDHHMDYEIQQSDQEGFLRFNPYGNFRSMFGGNRGLRNQPISTNITTVNGQTIIEESDGRGGFTRRIIRNRNPNQDQPQFPEINRNRMFINGAGSFGDFFRLLNALAGGERSQGLTKQEIKNLEKIKFKKQKQQVKKQEREICTICYCQFQEQERIIKLRCKHMYHEECIVKWLQKNAKCPVCKTPQTNRPIYNEE